MFRLLLPRVVNNRFRGRRVGYWLMAPVLFVKIGIALVSMLTPAKPTRLTRSTFRTIPRPRSAMQ